MRTTLKFLLISISLVLCQQEVFAQIPDYSGTWVLNLEKSKLEDKPEGLTSSIFVIKQNGENFSLKRYHIYGDKKKKIGFKMVADGKTRRVKILFKGRLEWVGNTLVATLYRKGFSNVVRYKFGDDENEFIADEVFKGIPKDYQNHWVFDRQK